MWMHTTTELAEFKALHKCGGEILPPQITKIAYGVQICQPNHHESQMAREVRYKRLPDMDASVPPKRQKTTGPYSDVLRLRVQRATQQRLGLADPDILQISNVAYVKDNGLKTPYIRDIAKLLFDTKDELKIVRGIHGYEPAEEDSSSWTSLDDNSPIEGGVYLLKLSGKSNI